MSNTTNKTKPVKIKRVLTVANILNQNIERVDFKGEWFEAFRNPQNRGIWFVWGNSGSGKSAFLMQMAYEFARNEKVLYDPLEEETDDSDFIERTKLFRMNEVEKNFNAQTYNAKQLDAYLSKRGSANIVIVDSITYFFKRFDEYLAFKKKWAHRKIIIFSGHAQGKEPRTEFEKSVMYDAKMKIFTSAYLATCKGRTIGPNGGLYIIWQEGYDKLRGASEN